jgi:hypothetical protein
VRIRVSANQRPENFVSRNLLRCTQFNVFDDGANYGKAFNSRQITGKHSTVTETTLARTQLSGRHCAVCYGHVNVPEEGLHNCLAAHLDHLRGDSLPID